MLPSVWPPLCIQIYISLFAILLYQLQNKEQEISKLTQKLQHAQDDLLCAEHEKENLQRKVVALESALETPTSRHTLRRIFERYKFCSINGHWLTSSFN